MFNFFNEIKNKARSKGVLDDFTIVNLSGREIYVEGHLGLITISGQLVLFKVKGGTIEIVGDGLIICELTENTLIVEGRIEKVGRA